MGDYIMYRLFTHNDLDGVGCGILAKIAFGDKVDIRYNSVMGLDFQVERFLEKANEKTLEDDFLFITDLSVNSENASKMNDFYNQGGKVELIDHHKSALHLNDFPWGKVTVEYEDGRLASATSLFYEYLVKEGFLEESSSLGEFVELVRQYDTWEWDRNNNTNAKQLNDLFFMMSIDEFEEKMTTRIQENPKFEFDDFERKLLELEEEKMERYIRRKKRELVQIFISDFCAGIVHAESYHSELGNELGKENPHLDYIAILNMGGKKISFRTIHDYVDVSAVADQFGGGGHAKAAGCSLTDEAYKLYVQQVFPLDPMRPDAFRNHYNLKASEKGTLLENREGNKYYVYPKKDKWVIEENGSLLEHSFNSYEETERYLKRFHSAWLVRDEVYVEYLQENNLRSKKTND